MSGTGLAWNPRPPPPPAQDDDVGVEIKVTLPRGIVRKIDAFAGNATRGDVIRHVLSGIDWTQVHDVPTKRTTRIRGAALDATRRGKR